MRFHAFPSTGISFSNTIHKSGYTLIITKTGSGRLPIIAYDKLKFCSQMLFSIVLISVSS